MNVFPAISLFGYVLTLELMLLVLASSLVALALVDRPGGQAVESNVNRDHRGVPHGCAG